MRTTDHFSSLLPITKSSFSPPWLLSTPNSKEISVKSTMSTTPNSYPSLCSSPPLQRTVNSLTTQTLSFVTSPFKQTLHKKPQTLSFSIRLGNSTLEKQSVLIVRASTENEADGSATEEVKYEEYEVEVEQPYGLRFAKGRDGGTYIDAIAPGGNADKTKMFTVGDKVVATSAVFGTEIWPAAEYGRTMYTIRQRIGPLLMKMEKRYGKMDDDSKLTEKEIIRAERNSGIVSGKLREIQMQNYLRKKEQKETRARELREGLQLYKSSKYEEALEKFESVLGSKPEPNEASVASYNVACCYSKLNQMQAGLSALEAALQDGFEDFKRIRSDPDLENIRKTEEFESLMKKFDESFINENALNAIKSLFGFGKS